MLVLKDVTSIMSMGRDARASVLAALREVSDGYWERNLGVDGGQTLSWRGRCTLIGAVTTAWDEAHGVVATMGDRFPLVRMPDAGALAAGRQALANTGHEEQMRKELSEAVGGLLQHTHPSSQTSDLEFILPLANFVTWARTAVPVTTGATSSAPMRGRCRPASPSNSARSTVAPGALACPRTEPVASSPASRQTHCPRCAGPSSGAC
ncbi:MAG: hypothetical protein H0U35_12090 [Sporichthyaceae bacterium]|nr:hypothetical protein [Sporichthyaceae bacterium]